ncbi:MAG: response regulator [Desulfovibrio sp.]
MQSVQKEIWWKVFLSMCGTFLLLISITMLWFYHAVERDIEAENDITKKEQISCCLGLKFAVEADLKHLANDVLILASHSELHRYMHQQNSSALNHLVEELAAFIEITQSYDQIRLLALNGDEVLRVNYTDAGPYIVPENELQNKVNRYYFKETIITKQGSVYISPFDLNIEHGRIELPFKPMIRIGTPLIVNGRVEGALLLNYLGDRLLDNIGKISGTTPASVMLLNSDGYWLYNEEDPTKEWGFMLPDMESVRFGTQYPEVWQQMSGQDCGQIVHDGYLYSFETINWVEFVAEKSLHDLQWKLVSRTKLTVMDDWRELLMHKYFQPLLAIVILIMIATGLRGRSKKNRLSGMAALEVAAQVADDANSAKGDFLAKMSHEIRTPMNAILGLTHLVMKTKLTEKQRDYLRKVDASAKSLLGLINDILDFSKIEAGKIRVESIPFDLVSTLDNIANVFAVSAQDKGIELIFHIEEDVPIDLIGDSLRVSQVLTNLVSNAIKYVDVGEVVLTVSKTKQVGNTVHLLFIVADTGTGIDDDMLDRLFTPFEQADVSTTRKYGGTGLGLTICRKLIELMDGSVEVQSVVGEGTEVYVSLPFGVNSSTTVQCCDALTDGLRVLLVEGNDAARSILRKVLESYRFQVDSAESGYKGLQRIKKSLEADNSLYDLVVLESTLPDMDAIEFSKSLMNKIKPEQKPKILMLSVYNREDLQKRARELGIDAIVLKPINRSLFFEVILDVFNNGTHFNESVVSEREAELGSTLQGVNILLAEDNKINQQIARELIEQEGGVVTVACNGREAVKKVQENSYDLVLMDIQMPEMSGLTASRTIRDMGHVDLPIIAMTAHAMKEDVQKSFDAGMNDHVVKPIDPDEFIQTILHWKNRGANGGASSSRVEVSVNADSPELADTSVLEFSKGLRRVRGNRDLYLKLLNEFFRDYQAAVVFWGESSLDSEESSRMLHALKGAAANVGANQAVDALDGLQRTNEGKTQDLFQLERSIQLLRAAIEEKELGIQIRFIDADSEESGGDVALNIDAEINELCIRLQRNEIRALKDVESLCRMLSEDYKSTAEELLACIGRYDFAGTIENLRVLQSKAERGRDET